MNPDEELAKLFHKHYKAIASEYGYETRLDTDVFNSESSNGKLWLEASREVLNEISQSRDWSVFMLRILRFPCDGRPSLISGK
jgi:hypothetical protein